MNTPTHEYCIGQIVEEILKQLHNISGAAKIDYLGSPRLELVIDESDYEGDANIAGGDGHNSLENRNSITYDRHGPDAAFGDRKDKFPGVVLEVAYSQQRKNLRDLAERYILGSDANIRVVIGIDLDYQQRQATISIWRPEITTRDGIENLECVEKLSERVYRAFICTQTLLTRSRNFGIKITKHLQIWKLDWSCFAQISQSQPETLQIMPRIAFISRHRGCLLL